MPDTQVCCLLEICCSRIKATRALAEHLADAEPEAESEELTNVTPGSYTDIAGRLLGEFQLVPKELEAHRSAPAADAGRARLARLHAHIKTELTAALRELGHKTE